MSLSTDWLFIRLNLSDYFGWLIDWLIIRLNLADFFGWLIDWLIDSFCNFYNEKNPNIPRSILKNYPLKRKPKKAVLLTDYKFHDSIDIFSEVSCAIQKQIRRGLLHWFYPNFADTSIARATPTRSFLNSTFFERLIRGQFPFFRSPLLNWRTAFRCLRHPQLSRHWESLQFQKFRPPPALSGYFRPLLLKYLQYSWKKWEKILFEWIKYRTTESINQSIDNSEGKQYIDKSINQPSRIDQWHFTYTINQSTIDKPNARLNVSLVPSDVICDEVDVLTAGTTHQNDPFSVGLFGNKSMSTVTAAFTGESQGKFRLRLRQRCSERRFAVGRLKAHRSGGKVDGSRNRKM